MGHRGRETALSAGRGISSSRKRRGKWQDIAALVHVGDGAAGWSGVGIITGLRNGI